jgi:hypothetical protein
MHVQLSGGNLERERAESNGGSNPILGVVRELALISVSIQLQHDCVPHRSEDCCKLLNIECCRSESRQDEWWMQRHADKQIRL